MDKILLHDAGQIFEEEPRLIELPQTGYGVFVGDTHGDLNATQTVLERYLGEKENTMVFLGDYVDRGPHSRENIDLLLETKVKHKDRVYLLMGNHEAFKKLEFDPADFWDSLTREEKEEYGSLLLKLPLAASGNGLLALHGAPSDVKSLKDINQIKPDPGSKQWLQMIWCDLADTKCEQSYTHEGDVRACFGSYYFERVMRNLEKKVIIRSHQPGAAGIMYNNRCLTIFTSHAYLPKRTVAVADLGKETVKVDDLDIRTV
jgi:predicted phosphodiesterase